jgi:hypothetical protein
MDQTLPNSAITALAGPAGVPSSVMMNQGSGARGGRRASVTRPVPVAAVAVALAVLTGCSAGPAPRAVVRPAATARAATSLASATRGRSPSPSVTPARPSAPPSPSVLLVAPPSAASLPQTSARPSTDDPAFGNAVHDIWLAVTTGDADDALPAFFPEKAYEQVKAIGDPAADWQGRLWYDFTLDVDAVHKLVPRSATLVKVIVPAQYTQWVGVGACYNRVGYWNVPGARVVYRAGGVTRSFGIASFISWRGDWYLVHLGAEVRGGAYGIVDDPEPGEGTPGPPGGC